MSLQTEAETEGVSEALDRLLSQVVDLRLAVKGIDNDAIPVVDALERLTRE